MLSLKNFYTEIANGLYIGYSLKAAYLGKGRRGVRRSGCHHWEFPLWDRPRQTELLISTSFVRLSDSVSFQWEDIKTTINLARNSVVREKCSVCQGRSRYLQLYKLELSWNYQQKFIFADKRTLGQQLILRVLQS